MDNLINTTKNLISILNKLKQKFEQNIQPGEGRDFFELVKQETIPVFQLLEQWEKQALDYISYTKVVNLHAQQIASTKEKMEALLLPSYYLNVRKRRYMEIYKSCFYIVSQLLKEIDNEG